MKKIKEIYAIVLISILTVPVVTYAEDCNSIFGTFQEELDTIFNAMKYLGPIAVFAFTVYEYAFAIFSKNAEDLQKCNNKLKYRLVLLVILIVLPAILNTLLGIFDPDYKTCVQG